MILGAHTATPCGLLFNELAHAPQLVIASVLSMVDFVLELDEGKYSPYSRMLNTRGVSFLNDFNTFVKYE